jgi:uncharacterized membrane protein YcaP (DUF421 family)
MIHALWGGSQPALYAAVKAATLFITAAVAFRLTERRTIAEFSQFDWVTAVAVGAIIGRTATASDIAWFTGAAALVALILMHAAVARLRFSPVMSRLTDPPVRLLIHEGRVDDRNLRRCRLTRADLDAVLRQHGHQDAEEVGLAVFESKGAVSVLPKSHSS